MLISGCGGDPVDDISKTTGLSKDQAGNVLTKLKEVGVTKFDGVDTLDKEKGYYYINDEKYGRVYFCVLDGKLNAIESSQGIKVYNANKKIIDLDDVTFSNQQMAEYQVLAQNAVKDQLKAPASATFDNIKMMKDKNGSVLITGTVDVQNSFGAKLRKTFMVTVDSNKNVISANIL